MTPVEALVCTRCGRRYAPDADADTCPDHDGVGGILDVRYDYDRLQATASEAEDEGLFHSGEDLWTYEPLLPVDGASARLGAGGTPLLETPRLSDRLGVDAVVKDETGNPTGSTKDRASAVLVARAVERGHDVVTCASTGNAGASLAAYAARAGLECRVFVPADLPDAKGVQPRLYGATVLAVDGSYGDAYDLCRTVAADRGWDDCNAATNPYALEGTRTLGFELAADAPDADWVAMPMGNGCSLAAVWKGLREARRVGPLSDAPKLLGVQAAGASAIHDRFASRGGNVAGAPAESLDAGTVADGIDVRDPHNADRACSALRESDGASVLVTDGEILDAQALLGETEGVFAEPASAAAVAGVRTARERELVDAAERVAIVATGTGLKDIATAGRAVADRIDVAARPGAVPDRFE